MTSAAHHHPPHRCRLLLIRLSPRRPHSRDDESTGCDYEMLAQMKAKEVLQEPGLKLESEWSAEIDAAVSSSAPKM